MGLMSDEILGTPHGSDNPLRTTSEHRNPTKNNSSHKKSYLRKYDVDKKKKASEHRRTTIMSSLFSALENDDSSSNDSSATELASPQVSAHSLNDLPSDGLPTTGVGSLSNQEAKIEASKRLKKRLPSRSPNVTKKLSSVVPPPPPGSAPPSTRRKTLFSPTVNDSDNKNGGLRKTSGRERDSNNTQKRKVKRSVSLSGGRKGGRPNASSDAPCAPTLERPGGGKKRVPGRSKSLSGANKTSSSGVALKRPSVHQASSLSAFLGSTSKRAEHSDDEDDDCDSQTSEQSWISWAANSALKPLEKLYDDVNGNNRSKKKDDEEEELDNDFPNTEAENYSTKLSTTDKIMGLRFVASKQKRRSLYV